MVQKKMHQALNLRQYSRGPKTGEPSVSDKLAQEVVNPVVPMPLPAPFTNNSEGQINPMSGQAANWYP